jgi:hypothetical protein
MFRFSSARLRSPSPALLASHSDPFFIVNRGSRLAACTLLVFAHLPLSACPRQLAVLERSSSLGLCKANRPPVAFMSTITTAPPHLNGISAAPAEARREAEFLKQILQIRDQVLASKHPRIHLPSKVIEQIVPRPPQIAPPTRPTNNSSANGTGSFQSLPPRPDSSLQPTQTHEFVSPAPPIQRPYSAKSASSGIDPVLLTKSDHLIRAELQLKRQQIERLLKDQFDKKGRGNDVEEREAHFNVEECLIQAQLRVPPVSGLQSTTTNSDGAESFDENSYYSSKADSWSSEEVDPNQSASADVVRPLASPAKQPATGAHAQSRPVQPAVIDLDDEPYEPADDIEIYEPESTEMQDEAEEEDYSPPPADVGMSEPIRGRARDRAFGNNGGTNGYERTISFILFVIVGFQLCACCLKKYCFGGQRTLLNFGSAVETCSEVPLPHSVIPSPRSITPRFEIKWSFPRGNDF